MTLATSIGFIVAAVGFDSLSVWGDCVDRKAEITQIFEAAHFGGLTIANSHMRIGTASVEVVWITASGGYDDDSELILLLYPKSCHFAALRHGRRSVFIHPTGSPPSEDERRELLEQAGFSEYGLDESHLEAGWSKDAPDAYDVHSDLWTPWKPDPTDKDWVGATKSCPCFTIEPRRAVLDTFVVEIGDYQIHDFRIASGGDSSQAAKTNIHMILVNDQKQHRGAWAPGGLSRSGQRIRFVGPKSGRFWWLSGGFHMEPGLMAFDIRTGKSAVVNLPREVGSIERLEPGGLVLRDEKDRVRKLGWSQLTSLAAKSAPAKTRRRR